MTKTPVLIAGIAGASLGTEIIRCLDAAGEYEIFGCDRHPHATGRYLIPMIDSFTTVGDRNYADQLIEYCLAKGILFIIPGAEATNKIISDNRKAFERRGITPVVNSPTAVNLSANKLTLFSRLDEHYISHPRTWPINWECEGLTYPCIVKPSTDSGGSVNVRLVENQTEAREAFQRIAAAGSIAMAQAYIPLGGGEYTVGILSSPYDGYICSEIAMRRMFPSKLSLSRDDSVGTISSGYTQGMIDTSFGFSSCIKIAKALDSRGPLNIQGRIGRDGVFLPFETNGRFSASCYMRALAGRNEPHMMMRMIMGKSIADLFPPLKNRQIFLRDFATIAVDPV